jgi:LacI family transcriptional regulator
MERIPTFRAFLQGAKKQGELYGYKVDEFRAFGAGMSPKRLEGVLQARGVRGVLIGPRWLNEPEVDLDWGAYSCVLVGETRATSGLYRVSNNHVHACVETLRRLVAAGCRRIGVLLMKNYEAVRGHEYLLGVDEARRVLGRRAQYFVRKEAACEEGEFWDWVRAKRLDAVVSLHKEPGLALESSRPDFGGAIAYANLDVPPGSAWAGIDQHSGEIGKAAMDMLRNLLHAVERGASLRPRMLLVEGSWVNDGGLFATAQTNPRAASGTGGG